MDEVYANVSWTELRSVKFASAAFPELPGVYVYLDVARVAGLPLEIKYAYIGKSKNLRKRSGSHELNKEVNEKIKTWMKVGKGAKELWYTTCESEDEAIILEAFLISSIKPSINVRYPKGGK